MARNVQAWWLPIYLKRLFCLGNRFYKLYTKLAAFTVLAHRRPHLTQWRMLGVGTQITKNASSQNTQPLAFSAARVSHTKNTDKWRRLYAKTERAHTFNISQITSIYMEMFSIIIQTYFGRKKLFNCVKLKTVCTVFITLTHYKYWSTELGSLW